MAYEVYDSDLHRSAADYVDKLLKGVKPADLPVQQPSAPAADREFEDRRIT